MSNRGQLFVRLPRLFKLCDLIQRLFQGDFKILEVDRLGQKIKRTAVHCCPDIVQVTIGGDDYDLDDAVQLSNPGKQRQAVHNRHVEIGQNNLDLGGSLE